MDVYKFHARKQTAAEDPNVAKWKGGDYEDRREYIAKKKAELGADLDRVLTLSSKRTTHAHTIKSDMGAIEFDGVFRKQHINEDWIQPGDMSWSLEDFNAKSDRYEAMIEKKADEKIVEAIKAHEELASKLSVDAQES